MIQQKPIKRNMEDLYDETYNLMCRYLREYYPVSDKLCDELFDKCPFVHFKKGELFVSEDRECHNIYFIMRGFCSCFYVKDGKEYILHFFKEGDFGMLFHTFLSRQKAFLNLKATEDTLVLCVSRDNFDYFWHEYHDFVLLFYKVFENYAIEREERYYLMRSNCAEDRVKHYSETHEIQHLMKHVPQYCIASYLNMTPETFAKILARRNKNI